MNLLFLSLALLSSSTFAAPLPRPAGMPDLPPDASGRQYADSLKHRPRQPRVDDGLTKILAVGERNLQWLDHINESLAPGHKLSLTSKETEVGYPIDAPNEYNPTLIQNRFRELQCTYPADLAAVAFGKGPLPATFPGDQAAYLHWSNQLDRVYQIAGRWRSMQDFLPYLESRQADDIRGYYFLSRMPDRESKLSGPAKLAPAERAQVEVWLVEMCLNQDNGHDCAGLVQQSWGAGKDANALYASWAPQSKATFDTYFRIPEGVARPDFHWEKIAGGLERLVTPFTDPGTDAFRHYLQDNLQDEWRMGNWHLEMPFTADRGHPHLVFQAGALPHANAVGGDEIVMNKSQPLTEYDAQWTIRHEFGHIMGFLDCYLEFYVPERNTIVNYQIDTKDIMCSRLGHIEPQHVTELRRAYAN